MGVGPVDAAQHGGDGVVDGRAGHLLDAGVGQVAERVDEVGGHVGLDPVAGERAGDAERRQVALDQHVERADHQVDQLGRQLRAVQLPAAGRRCRHARSSPRPARRSGDVAPLGPGRGAASIRSRSHRPSWTTKR